MNEKMGNFDYKTDIIKTRVGGLGSSDAKMLYNITTLGHVPSTAYERLAVLKGLIPYKECAKTVEMAFGDFIESKIYEYLSNGDSSYVSNPYWESVNYSRENVKLFCHPDIIRYDYDKKILYVYEVKATKYNAKATKDNYRKQMFIEWSIANELARKLGKVWRVNLYLVHYDTNGVDVTDADFEPERLSLHKMSFGSLFDINKGMDIVKDFLKDFTEYYSEDEINSKYLPENVQEEFAVITKMLSEIKERENKVAEFKEKLYTFMLEKGIKSIKNDAWNITRVDGSESVSFNAKSFLSDYEKQHPRKYKTLIKLYEKRTQRKGYVNIKIK